MRPKRLIFAAKASQGLFDETIYRIFSDIPKCLNQRDDILIGGKNMEEHNRTLKMVSQRALDYGITFILENVNLMWMNLSSMVIVLLWMA